MVRFKGYAIIYRNGSFRVKRVKEKAPRLVEPLVSAKPEARSRGGLLTSFLSNQHDMTDLFHGDFSCVSTATATASRMVFREDLLDSLNEIPRWDCPVVDGLQTHFHAWEKVELVSDFEDQLEPRRRKRPVGRNMRPKPLV